MELAISIRNTQANNNNNIKVLKKKNVLIFNENILDVDFGDMKLIKKLNKGIRFYYVILVFMANMHVLFL